MRKSVILFGILLLIVLSCSKDDETDCGCRTVSIKDHNYRLNLCEDEVAKWEEIASEKQARLQEEIDNCQ